jgi:hypothetical protein
MVLNALQDEIDQHGSGAERAALGREAMRRRPEVLPA